MSENKNYVDLFNMDADDASMSFLAPRNSNHDGLYRANPKEAKDKAKGYCATIRFLPNVMDNMTVGDNAVQKHVHYINMPNYPDLQGYCDSLSNFPDSGEKCPLCTLYWKLNKSKNQAEVERSELLKKSTKYYSYVLVIEDEQHPELIGKILVFPYGYKIIEKIKAENNGENSDGRKCNIFNPASGKDFRLVVKEIGGFPNYDSSFFKESSPLKIWNVDKLKFINTPVVDNEDGKKSIDPKAQETVFKYLMNRDKGVNLDDHRAKPWSDETRDRVNRIVDVMLGKDVSTAREKIANNPRSTATSDDIANDDPFSNIAEDMEDDDFFKK